MAKRILIPVDAEERAEVALVADLARSSGATVRLLHVGPLPQTRTGSCRAATRSAIAGTGYVRSWSSP